jgi:hypothetical protein
MRRLISSVIVGLAAVVLTVPFAQTASALGGSFDWVTRDYNGGMLDDPTNGASGVRQGISSDGRYVLYNTAATDAVPNDTNGFRDLFMRDRQTGTTTLVSVGDSEQQGNNDALNGDGAISGDGRYVVFSTYATNFASPDFNNSLDVFLRDTQAGTTTRICTSPYGGFGCSNPSISRDGQYITYGIADPFSYGGQPQLFRFDRVNNQTQLVSQNSSGQAANQSTPGWARMSADGRYVVFASYGNNLVTGDTNNRIDIFRKDVQTGDVLRVNVTATGDQANQDSQWPSISDDGRYVTFTSVGSNFVAGDTNGNWDLFLKDMDLGTVQVVGGALNQSQLGSLTGDGQQVVFQTSLTGFTASDTDTYQDVFAWDRVTNTNSRLSELSGGGALGFYGTGAGQASIDGRHTPLFTNNMIDPGDTHPAQEVYVHSRGPAAPANLTIPSPTKKPVLTWNAVAGATSYNVYRNGSNVGSSTTTTYTDNTAPNGTVEYYVTAIDGTGEGGKSNTVSVVVDTVRPVMNFTAPTSFAGPFTTGPTVTVTASDPGSGLQVLVIHVYTSANQLLNTCGTATSTQLAAGTMSCDLSSLPDGTYYIKAGSFDNAGNNRTINSGNFTIAH